MNAGTIIRSSNRIPRRENMRNVPKTWDGGDIDERGHWAGAEVSCLECRCTAPMRTGITSTYLLAQLECGECWATFAEFWV